MVVQWFMDVSPENLSQDITLDAGYFLDGPALMAFVGQSSVVHAMQPVGPRAVVLSDKALLIRWSGRQILRKIINSGGMMGLM